MSEDSAVVQEYSDLTFEGKSSDLILVIVKNILLTLLTFGIYFPYAKTNTRKFFWNHLKFDGQYFDYRGTGKELLKGYLFVATIVILYNVAIKVITSQAPVALPFFLIISYGLLIFVIIPRVIYGAHSYIMSRTKLRGVSFQVKKEGKKTFVKTSCLESLRVIFTLGFGYAWFKVNTKKIKLENTCYGDNAFSYTAKASDMFMFYLKGYFFSIFTLGFYSFWNRADILKYEASRTYFQEKSFVIDINGMDILKLTFLNLFAIIFTLGLATPFVIVHNLCFYAERIKYNGDIDYSIIKAIEVSNVSGLGDNFGDALDLDIGL